MLTAARISAGLSIVMRTYWAVSTLPARRSVRHKQQSPREALTSNRDFDLVDTHLSSTLDIEGAEIGKGFRAEGLEVNSGTTAITAGGITIAGSWDLARSKLVGAMNFP